MTRTSTCTLTPLRQPQPDEQEVQGGGEEGTLEEGAPSDGRKGGTALAQEEELQFSPDPEVEPGVELQESEVHQGDTVETVRQRARKKVKSAILSGRFQQALRRAVPPDPARNPPTLETSYEPQSVPSQRPEPSPTQPQPVVREPKAAGRWARPSTAQQPRQRGFVRYQHAGRDPPARPIPMEVARDSAHDLPDHVWRSMPTTEPGGLTVPQQDILVHPNTQVISMDVDDDDDDLPPQPAQAAPQPAQAAPQRVHPWRSNVQEAPIVPAPKPRTPEPPPPKRTRVVFSA